jgi:pullulanase
MTASTTSRRSLALFLLSALAWVVPAGAAHTPEPSSVTVAGSLQSELGCSEDWQPACAATHLDFDADDQVWQKTFTVPAGNHEYKAPLNDSWDENYGLHAALNGGNIPLSLAAETSVKFFYSHETHWITDNVNSTIAVAPGSFQSELGCPGDWQPDCLRSWLQDPDGDGIFVFRTSKLPAGSYEVKVAVGESWSENYGLDGAPGGANIPFTVGADCDEVVFTWDSTSKVLTIGAGEEPAQPASVTIAGSLQSELGCPGDWQPECSATHLTFDATDGIWQQSFDVPAGSWEYKAALNGSWGENYGLNATFNGPNVPLSLDAAASVKFYYDHETHWVADNRSKIIAVAPGSFQSELGCPGDWQPDCLRSWLQDPDGDGIYTFSTSKLPAGNYEVKVAINESWDENYGAEGAPNGGNISFTVPSSCAGMFFSYDPSTHVLTVSADGAPRGNIARAQAYWVSEDTIAWKPAGSANVQEDSTFALVYDADGGLLLNGEGVQGGTAIPLAWDPEGLSAEVLEKLPHLSGYAAFKIPANRLGEVPEALKGQLAIEAKAGDGTLIDATSLQIQGVLDDLYTANGPLGVTFAADHTPAFHVWAPTAREVRLLVFDSSTATDPSAEVAMTRGADGVWTATGTPAWYARYYLYEVTVYARSTGRVETNRVTDPYSVSLSINSQRSQIIDLANDASLEPGLWDNMIKPRLRAFEDIVLYELHLRDFSANDPSVPDALKGTFKAFTLQNSNGMRHLRKLADAGLTHVHLLPVFDIATINEDKSQWRQPEGDLSIFPPDSEEQQARVMAVADLDPFNWGYDPWHYTVPEGSYSTDPDGPARIREFREMVMGLDRAGLRVVMDVVYNHTNAAGQNEKSVLDRIVPGYYHRLNADGNIETSTCCQNTATEFNMMEKLMIDSVLVWAREYKVDGFRFDLMGHHMKRNMVKLRQALDALTLEEDGVDGKKIYLYGEGWNFGEVANNARGVQATQANMAGTGIGTFSDRMRDGVRGGGPFSGVQEQGFINGLFTDPNGVTQGTPAEQLQRLLLASDWIRVGLAGTLKDYVLEDRTGNEVEAEQIDYNGQPAGYTADPQEVINYVEAHDNETLFDAIAAKAPVDTPMDQRVRMQNLGISIVGFAQGVPFYHAGVELLRSKSMDRNSYNSGDWFNKVDWTGQDNNWGVGLPPAPDNQASWPIQKPLLANPALDPAPADIAKALAHFQETLEIRKSTPLLRLRTAVEIMERVRFHNTGPDQIPGLIVYSINDNSGDLDHQHARVVVLINSRPEAVNFSLDAGNICPGLKLHPRQRSSADPVVRTSTFQESTCTFRVPGRTAAVFVKNRPADRQLELLRGSVDELVADRVLNGGQGNALEAKLEAAERQLAAGRTGPAANQVRAFMQQVQALRASGVLTGEQALWLLQDANAVLDAIAEGD